MRATCATFHAACSAHAAVSKQSMYINFPEIDFERANTMAHGRLLYVFGADMSPATYITNYLVTAICFCGIAWHLAQKPRARIATGSAAWGRFVPSNFLLVHLGLYGITYLIAGIQHQVGFYEDCPGLQMPQNVTVPCPASGANADGFIRAYLLFLGFAAFQLMPVAIALGGFATANSLRMIVIVCELASLGLAVVGVAASAFTVVGAVMAINNLFLAVMCAIGRCRSSELASAKAFGLAGGLLLVLGAVVQFGFTGACGSAAYRRDGAEGCPFGGDGVAGINHNFVYHVLEILSKICLVLAARNAVVVSADATRVTKAARELQQAGAQA